MKQELGDAETMAASPALGAQASGELEIVEQSRYEIDTELARGGMGRILHAIDRRHGRRVAIKELLTDTPSLRARFRREALITARLQHPAIVPVYEAGRWPSGEPFYAMKMVEGRSLDAVIAGRRTLERRMELLPNVIAVAEAIAYAHERKVIHRDLKPANVLVGDFGETVVIDWGLAKDLNEIEPPVETSTAPALAPSALDATAVVTLDEVPSGVPSTDGLTVHGHAMGTPAYMAPEQARGEPADERADVYALGGILYHLLTGRMPYADSKDGGALVERKRLDEPPTSVPELEAKAPPDLVAIVAKAMARKADERYPTAKPLVADLRRFENGQLVSVHDYSTGELLRRWLRRHRVVVAFATVLVAVVAIGGTLAVTRVLRERDRATQALVTAEAERTRAEEQSRRAEEQSRLAAEERATAIADRERAEESEQDALESSNLAKASTQALVEGWVQARFAGAIRACYQRGGKATSRHASLLLEVDDTRGIARATPVQPFGTSADACIVAASKDWKFPPGTMPGTYGLNLMADGADGVRIGFAASDAVSIGRMMKRDYEARVEVCYQKLLRSNAKAAGHVEVALRAGEDGTITVPKLEAFDPTLEACVREELERWAFAPPRDGNGQPTVVTVEATTNLAPPSKPAPVVARTNKEPPAEPPPPVVDANAPPPVSLQDQDKAMVRRYIKKNLARIQYCYEKALADQPELAGTVVVGFTIGMGGSVGNVSASGMDEGVAACIVEVIKGIEFPSPSNGGFVKIAAYPFNFSPQL